jgi:UDPglucose--hexose-1-phosphate uridylyltransferase
MTQLVTCVGNVRANGMVNLDYESSFVFENDFAALKQRNAFEENKNETFKAKPEENFSVVCFHKTQFDIT